MRSHFSQALDRNHAGETGGDNRGSAKNGERRRVFLLWEELQNDVDETAVVTQHFSGSLRL